MNFGTGFKPATGLLNIILATPNMAIDEIALTLKPYTVSPSGSFSIDVSSYIQPEKLNSGFIQWKYQSGASNNIVVKNVKVEPRDFPEPLKSQWTKNFCATENVGNTPVAFNQC